MQLQVDVNSVKSTIFLELLNLFKKDNMINDYKIIDNNKITTYDDEVFNDLSMLSNSLRDAKNGLGHRTSTVVNIKDV
jgi:predicted metalloprotease with PDZ domain